MSHATGDSEAPKTVREGMLEMARTPLGLAALIFPFLLLIYFFGFQAYFQATHGATVLKWLTLNWNKGNELEHAWLVPPIMASLVFAQRKELLAHRYAPSTRDGVILIVLAGLLFLASVRTLQPRLAIGALPLFALGIICFQVGRASATSLAIPLGLIYFTVPVPGLTQATNGLQLIATHIAFHISRLCGVALEMTGNQLSSASDKWGFDVAEGCSGLRSLLALTLVAAVYAYMTQKKPLKGLLVFAASVPLAIIANAIRVATIIILAEYVSPNIAGGIYHDWAGFLFFLAVGLSGLLLVDKLVNLSSTKVETRQIKSRQSHS